MSRLISIFLIGLSGYFVYQNRYRVFNLLLGNMMIRRLLIGSFFNMPGLRDKMMKSVFS